MNFVRYMVWVCTGLILWYVAAAVFDYGIFAWIRRHDAVDVVPFRQSSHVRVLS